MSRISALSLAHPRRTLLAAGALFVLGLAVGAPVAGALASGGFDDPHSESARADALITHATSIPPESTMIVLVRAGSSVASGPGRDLVGRVVADLRGQPQVAGVVDPLSNPAAGLVSRDGTSAEIVAAFSNRPRGNEAVAKEVAAHLAATYPQTTAGGFLIADRQVSDQVTGDLGRAELIAAPILFAVLVFFLRGVVVALLPLAAGALSIVTTFIGLRAINAATPLSIFALNLVTGLGLGLAIDYGLLIVTRYREEAVEHGYGAEALRRTIATAGRTVIFSSLTVAAAVASLLVFPQRFLYSMGAGGIIVTLVSAAVAVTLTPALLLVLGPRVERLGWYRIDRAAAERDRKGGWYRLSRWVMRRPLRIAVVTGTLMVLLGTPFLRIQFTSVDATDLPESTSARQVVDAVRTQFPADPSLPVDAVVQASATDPAVATRVGAFASALARLPSVRAVTPSRPLDAGTWLVSVIPQKPSLDAATQDLVGAMRDTAAMQPFPVLVGGNAAQFHDLQSSLRSHLPLGIALVALVTFVVLWAMTGSLVLPVKAVVMNLLTISAAFGLLVLVFQDGRLTGLLQYTSQGALESTQPILLFVLAFGLSTDYGVFLLTRIKEHHDAGLPTQEAVARGLEHTGRIVTAAAILLAIAIGAFASSSIVFIKELGVGSASAVLIDASIVRALLVPSLMQLLGEWNWWAPRALRALHRRLGLDTVEHGRGATTVAA
ncbi:MAG TPA: efflux RND transporter permease subunit [Candidatus Dormibacteraeota bacterium]|nr:efflux RND transporter permease subunit [Candidatus Dormibacteraeota bacterium]